MATFYLDFEGGNDANDGTTFANRWKTITSGATAARTAPGDTIRIMGSPASTSLGQNGVWTSQALQATKTLTAATNATPIAITITGHGYSTGDTVVVTGVLGNTAANGTWEITVTDANTFTLDNSAGNFNRTSGGTVRLRSNTRVMLASAVTQNIASTGPGRAAWTGTGGGAPSLQTTGMKEGAAFDRLNVSSSFTTGKHSYYTLPATLDLSSYQQVSFWVAAQNLPVAAGAAELRLCSDTTGDTVVNTVAIPATATNGRWMPVTVDTGSALGNSIASISLYINTNLSASTNVFIDINNIIACKASSAADSLTLTSLIGKNTTGETWWGIQSINGTRVMLDADTNATPTSTSVRGYYGTSETVTTWKRETIKLGPAASSTTARQTIQEGGTDGSPITYSGGWDRTDMSTQNLETWLDGVNGNGYAITCDQAFINSEKFAFTRFTRGFICINTTSTFQNHLFVAANNCTTTASAGALYFQMNQVIATVESAVANTGTAITLLNQTQGRFDINSKVCSNGNSGLYAGATSLNFKVNGAIGNLFANNGSGSCSIISGGISLLNLNSENNVEGIRALTSSADVILYKCLVSDSTETSFAGSSIFTNIFSQNHDQTVGNHKIFSSGALITSATDERKTASGISWKIQPTSTTRSATWPVTLSLAKVACAANSLVTVKAWMRRTNTDLTMRLVCKGGQIAGVDSDVVDSMTAAADTWAEQTITFTPTEVGVVEITAEAYGGTTFSGWVDDMTISQI
jgi:hypothetical protein